MSQPFLAEIRMFAGNFAPRGWAFCWGQILPIHQNTALFSLLGTNYGGNGQNTFGLPDLRGRFPVGTGQGPGLPPYELGEMSGNLNQTLTLGHLPAHTHGFAQGAISLPCTSGAGDTDDPNGSMLAVSAKGDEQYLSAGGTATGQLPLTVAASTIIPAGNNQPFSLMTPYLGMNYIICTEGIFPSRN